MKSEKIIYSLYRAKQITKKVYYNIMTSIKLSDRIDTIFVNSRNSKTSDPHRLLLNLSYETNLKRKDKYIPLWNLSIYSIWENIKKSYRNNKFKYQLRYGITKLNYLRDNYSVSDIQDYFKHIFKKYGEKTDNPSIRIYLNNTENTITFKIKTGFYLELLTFETMKLFALKVK